MAEPPLPLAALPDSCNNKEDKGSELKDGFGSLEFSNNDGAPTISSGGDGRSVDRNQESLVGVAGIQGDESKDQETIGNGATPKVGLIDLAASDSDDVSSGIMDDSPLLKAASRVTDSDHSDDGNKEPLEPSLSISDRNKASDEPNDKKYFDLTLCDEALAKSPQESKDLCIESDTNALDDHRMEGTKTYTKGSKTLLNEDRYGDSDDSTVEDRKQSPEEAKTTWNDDSNEESEWEEESSSENNYFGYMASSFDPEDCAVENGSAKGSFLSTTAGHNQAPKDPKASPSIYHDEIESNKSVCNDLYKSPEKPIGRSLKAFKPKTPKERKADLNKRRTDDGCVRPVTLKKNADGTYAKPRGRSPIGMIWDAHRGIWRFPHRQKKKEKSASFLPEEDKSASKQLKAPSNDEEKDWDQEPTSENQDDCTAEDELTHTHTSFKSSALALAESQEDNESRRRWTVDGCFLPRREPKKNVDGMYARPCGRGPPDMTWDARRALYVPKKSQMGKVPARSGEKQSRSSRKRSESAGRKERRGNKRARRNHQDKMVKPASMAISGQEPAKRERTSVASGTLSVSSKSTASTLKFLQTDSGKPREQGANIGDRVYAQWEGNEEYYWATIVDIKKTDVDQYKYSVSTLLCHV